MTTRTTRRTGPLLAVALLGVLAVSGCSGGEEEAAAAQASPVLTAGEAPAGAQTVRVGPVSLGVPATMTKAPNQMAPKPGQESVLYRADGSGGALGAGLVVIVGGAGSGVESAEVERDSLVKLHRDIRKNDTVRTSPVELEGFGDAYAVTHDQSTMHTLTVIGEVEGGAVVSVTATAPRPLFDELQLERSLGSLAAKA